MIVYFADRHMNILGVASDLLPGAFHLRDDMKTSDVDSGLSTFEATFDYKKDTHVTLKKYCAAGNFLLVKEKDGTYTPYTIIDKEDDISDRHIYVYAEDAGLDLLNEIAPVYICENENGMTAAEYILVFTADSGFEIGINEIAKNEDGSDKKRTLYWDGESTVTDRIRSVATEFDNAEIGYSFTIDKFRITHKYINLYKKHGKDVALELRFGREIDNIVEKESVANLVTGLMVVGGTPEATDDNPEPDPVTLVNYTYDDGDIYVEKSTGNLFSRDANSKWSRYLTESGTGEGYIMGTFDYDTTDQSELCNRAISELKELREPFISYEVSLNTIPENLKLGDTCRLVDDNGELYVSARLIELKVSECNNTREATFGDFKKLTSGINDKVEKLAEEFAKIQAAKTLYTWMVFADDASGTNMSTSSAGKEYIGIATNKISPDPDLTNPLLYTFTRISAVDGRGFTVRGSWAPNTSYSITGTNIDVVEYEGSTYACNNSHVSGQAFDPSKWVLIAEKGTDGEDGYSPTATVTKSGDTTTITITDKNGTTTQTILDGEDGHSPTITTTKSGTTTTILADGVSIGTVTDGDDGHSPSVTATKTDGVTTVKVDGTTIATINDGSSVIIQSATKVGDTTTVVLKDGSGIQTLTIKDGEDGDNGQPGSNGDDAYVHIAWATSADGSEGFSTSVSEGKTYMGSYSDHTLSDSQTPSDYNWSLIKGEDGYSPTATVTKSGSTATITITDKNGTTTETVSDGTSATSYSLIVSHAAIVKAAESNSYTPSSIDLTSKSQTGSGAFGNYAGRFKIETYNGTSWTARYTSSTNESSHSYTIPTNIDGIKSIRCSLYLAGGTTTLIDQQIVPIVSDGINGTSVSITAREYVESSSGTTTPSSGWSTTIPSVAEGKYLWTRISYSDGSYSYSVAKQGVSGQNGQSITVTETKYAEGTSATTAPTSGWGTSIPSVAEGNYLWTRVTYSDATVTYSVAKQGLSGDDGEDAYTVVLTNENYTFVGSETAAIASNTSTGVNVAECNVIAYKGATQVAAHIGTISGKPTGMTTSISSNDSTSAKFTVTVSTSMATKNGVLTIPVYIDPASSSGKLFNMKFTYSLAIKGVDGRAITGVTNYYLATSASSGVTRSTSGWTTSVQSMTSTNQYLWNYEKLTYSSGTTTTYTDPVIIGRYGKDGQGGSDGKGITGITEYYQKSSSNSQAPTTWVTTPPTTTTSEPYLWNYEVITYTTGDPFTSEKRVIGTHGATGETGAQGLSLRGVLIRNKWTDSQWNTTYGIGYTGNFSNYDILSSGNGPNGKLPISTWNVGDLYQLTGTSTDTGKAYIATLRYTTKRTSDTTSIPSEVIALSYAEKGTDGEDGNGIVSKTDYYLLADTMVSTDLSTAKSHVPHDLSGGIVTMTDAMGDIPFENVVVDVNYVQSGSGDPYPPGSTKNKFNPDTRTTGKYINGSGVISSDTNSSYSELIPVTVGTTYTYSGTSSSSGANNKRIHGYASGVWQQQIAFETIAASANFAITFTVPTGVDAIRISAYTADTNIQLEEGSTATSYVAYSNIRPISGWTGANVIRTGRNIFGGNLLRDGIKAAIPTASDHAGIRAIDYAVTAPVYSSFTKAASLDGKFKENTAYTFIVTLETTKSRSTNMRIYYTDGTHINIPNVSGINTKETKVVVTSPNKTVQNIYRVYSDTSVTRVYYDESGLFEGVLTLSDFEPYNGASYPVTWTEAGTVYGGTLDVTNGTLTVTMAMVDLGTLTWAKSGSIPSHFYAPSTASNIPYKYSDSCYMICSNYKYDGLGNATVGGYYGQNGTFRYYYASTPPTSTAREIYISDEAKASLTATEFKAAMSGVHLCYELDTPQTYQLTPVEINSLAGLNNVWADTGDISLTYFDEHDATWQTTPVDPNQYSRYQWWYYNTTYTDGRSIDSDPAIICVYNQDWYDDTQKAIAAASSANSIAQQAADNAAINSDAIGYLQGKIEGTTGQPGIMDRIGNLENTTATAQSVEDLRTEANDAINNLIAEYNLNEVLNWFHFDPDQGLIIGKNATTQDGKVNYVLRLEGDIIAFYEPKDGLKNLNDTQRVGYFQNRHLMSENMAALSTLDIGNFKFIKQDNGNLSFVYAG